MPELLTTFASALVKYRRVLLATTVVSAIALPQIVSAFDGTGTGRIIVAQKEDPKKKKEAPKAPTPPTPPQQKQVQPPAPPKAPPPVQKQVTPPPPPKAPPPVQKQVTPPPQKAPPPVQKQVQPPPQKAPPPVQKQVTPPPTTTPPPVQKQVTPPPTTTPPPAQKQVTPPPTTTPTPPPAQKQVTPPPTTTPPPLQKQVTPPPTTTPPTEQKQVQPPGKQLPPTEQKQVLPQQKLVPIQPPVQVQKFGAPKAPPPQIVNVNEARGKRREERVGNQVFIVEPGNRRMFRGEGNRLHIRHDEGERMRRWGNARFETRGQERYTIVNRGGYDVVTITDSRGHMLRRYRRFPDGREYGLIDNRRRFGVGAAVVGGVVLLGLAAPMITLPRERYIVDMETAPPAYLYEALEAPPLVPIERAYTLDEVRDNYELRARVRSVDINTINFATGSWEVTPDQIPRLQGLADAMTKVISENPATVFMIEGHTDAIGAAEDNMSLSDRRAEAVAEILTTNFNIPPENMVTQGYGEQHLRVATDGPNRQNRRVEVRNITGLMASGEPGQPGGPPGDAPPDGRPPG